MGGKCLMFSAADGARRCQRGAPKGKIDLRWGLRSPRPVLRRDGSRPADVNPIAPIVQNAWEVRAPARTKASRHDRCFRLAALIELVLHAPGGSKASRERIAPVKRRSIRRNSRPAAASASIGYAIRAAHWCRCYYRPAASHRLARDRPYAPPAAHHAALAAHLPNDRPR